MNRLNNKGFTLIELLAVIVVLALLLVIAVPRVLKIIEESKKESFRITGENLVKGATSKIMVDSMINIAPKIYTITNGAFVGESVPMSGELPDNGNITVLQDGRISLAVTIDNYCIKKDFDDDNVSVNDDVNNCRALLPTDSSCFTTTVTDNKVKITAYSNSCTKDVVIPKQINGLPVTTIGFEAFKAKDLTSLYIPNSVILIDEWGFSNNIFLPSVIIPNSVIEIRTGAFYYGILSEITIPKNVTSIGDHAFNSHPSLSRIEIPSNVNIQTHSFSSDDAFYRVYVNDNLKAGGIYTAPNQAGPWTKQ